MFRWLWQPKYFFFNSTQFCSILLVAVEQRAMSMWGCCTSFAVGFPEDLWVLDQGSLLQCTPLVWLL